MDLCHGNVCRIDWLSFTELGRSRLVRHVFCHEICLLRSHVGPGKQVFRQAAIPRRLEDVVDHEKDFLRLAEGHEVEGIYYQGITGMRADMSGARLVPTLVERAQLSLSAPQCDRYSPKSIIFKQDAALAISSRLMVSTVVQPWFSACGSQIGCAFCTAVSMWVLQERFQSF